MVLGLGSEKQGSVQDSHVSDFLNALRRSWPGKQDRQGREPDEDTTGSSGMRCTAETGVPRGQGAGHRQLYTFSLLPGECSAREGTVQVPGELGPC